jgi:hypothetical protein
VFHADVAKDRLRYCICCNGCTRMLQAFVPSVSPIFSDVCRKCVYLDVAYALHICRKCFIRMLSMFYSGFQVFFTCFCKCSDACFICL